MTSGPAASVIGRFTYSQFPRTIESHDAPVARTSPPCPSAELTHLAVPTAPGEDTQPLPAPQEAARPVPRALPCTHSLSPEHLLILGSGQSRLPGGCGGGGMAIPPSGENAQCPVPGVGSKLDPTSEQWGGRSSRLVSEGSSGQEKPGHGRAQGGAPPRSTTPTSSHRMRTCRRACSCAGGRTSEGGAATICLTACAPGCPRSL